MAQGAPAVVAERPVGAHRLATGARRRYFLTYRVPAAGPSSSWWASGGAVYLVLWLYGLLVDETSTAHFVPLNTADNWLHLFLGIGMVALGLVLSRDHHPHRRVVPDVRDDGAMPATPDASLPVDPGEVILLDGGLSTALEALGADLGSALWTARLLADAPHLIAAAHRAYFAAGARVAIAASYQASVPGLVAAGIGEQEAARLITSSVRIAQQVRDEMASDPTDGGPRPMVAASVGPYGAVLADGSEYRGRYGLTPGQLRDFHAPRLELLAATGPDLFAVETIPDVDEARVLVPLLDEIGIPAWFSYSVREGRTSAGQSLTEAYDAVAGSSSIIAAGVNCSRPDEVLGAVQAAVRATGLPAVAYPNRGGRWDAASRTWEGSSGLDVGLVHAWVAAGTRYVGGCCGTGPADIAALASALAA